MDGCSSNVIMYLNDVKIDVGAEIPYTLFFMCNHFYFESLRGISLLFFLSNDIFTHNFTH